MEDSMEVQVTYMITEWFTATDSKCANDFLNAPFQAQVIMDYTFISRVQS